MVNKKQEFLQYLAAKGKKQVVVKGKKQDYIHKCGVMADKLCEMSDGKIPTAEIIDAYVRRRWSGYVSKDKNTYKMLNDYSEFCETELPQFAQAFRKHIHDTFEGEARKAMRAYKETCVFIPKDTKIASHLLNGHTNEQFVDAFKSLQKVIYAMYDNIENGSPFDWGWPAWDGITAEGLNHNRVIMVMDAFAESGQMSGNMLLVDKTRFSKHNINKPIAKAKLMLKKFAEMGFCIKEFDNKNSSVFTVSYPSNPSIISVMYAYFTKGQPNKNHIRAFSYRFVEDPAVQTHETFFLAKTDGEPEQLREIYYWHYNEAVRHGFMPQECEVMGCYSYKKGSKQWMLLGSDSSYHEEDFLHSPNFKIAAKVSFRHYWKDNADKLDAFVKRFGNQVCRAAPCGEVNKRFIIFAVGITHCQ